MTKIPVENFFANCVLMTETLGRHNFEALNAHQDCMLSGGPALPLTKESLIIQMVEPDVDDCVQADDKETHVVVNLDSWELIRDPSTLMTADLILDKPLVFAIYTNDGHHVRVSVLLLDRDEDTSANYRRPGRVIGQSHYVGFSEAMLQTSLSRLGLQQFASEMTLLPDYLLPAIWAGLRLVESQSAIPRQESA